jgi:DNA-binding transcriptional MerR regulator
LFNLAYTLLNIDLVKNKFHIKDLENLSGIKAHTIRAWENRYHLLSPNRTDTNIRTYNSNALKKILNVSYLNKAGIKIGTIARLSDTEIEREVAKLAIKENEKSQPIQELKLAMMNFDNALFERMYRSQINQIGFRNIFYDIFLPFLKELGGLWHSKTINIAHEHFITHLIKQKLLYNLNTVEVDKKDKEDQRAYILFLPENEIHELGLLFLNYELIVRGLQTIYLGPSMETDALTYFNNTDFDTVFITYITVEPSTKDIPKYLKRFERKVTGVKGTPLWLLGHATKSVNNQKLSKNHTIFESIEALLRQLPQPHH